MLKIERDFAGSQIPGARPYQEDAQGFASLKEDAEGDVESLLTVLADGMGGENAGDFASKSVVQTFVDYCHHFESKADVLAGEDMPKMLLSAMAAANEGLADAMEKDPGLEGMGCTLLATVILDNSLYWLSVGDSPLYLYRDHQFVQINEDHSMMPVLQQLVEEGKIQAHELASHPDRNVLRAAMTGGEIELVDCPTAGFPLKPGDILIVASDGLQTLDEDCILSKLDRHSTLTADAITRKLLTAVKRAEKPRQDNASINVIRIPDPENDEPFCEEDMGKTRLLRRS
mgnify:CR=1 FL=1